MRSQRILNKLPKTAGLPVFPVRPPHALRRRLGDATIQELIAAYQAGSTTPELVVRYQVSKGALLDILHEQGLAIRKIGLTPEEVAEAVRLRAARLSYAGIGERLGVVGSTV